jgi:hypothetical protein
MAGGFARHDNRLCHNVSKAMEFALSRACGKKPRELMTPSSTKEFLYAQLYFGDDRRRTWDWSAILDVGIHR